MQRYYTTTYYHVDGKAVTKIDNFTAEQLRSLNATHPHLLEELFKGLPLDTQCLDVYHDVTSLCAIQRVKKHLNDDITLAQYREYLTGALEWAAIYKA